MLGREGGRDILCGVEDVVNVQVCFPILLRTFQSDKIDVRVPTFRGFMHGVDFNLRAAYPGSHLINASFLNLDILPDLHPKGLCVRNTGDRRSLNAGTDSSDVRSRNGKPLEGGIFEKEYGRSWLPGCWALARTNGAFRLLSESLRARMVERGKSVKRRWSAGIRIGA